MLNPATTSADQSDTGTSTVTPRAAGATTSTDNKSTINTKNNATTVAGTTVKPTPVSPVSPDSPSLSLPMPAETESKDHVQSELSLFLSKCAFIACMTLICTFSIYIMFQTSCSDIHIFTFIASVATFAFVNNILWLALFRPNLHDFKILLSSRDSFLGLKATPRSEVLRNLNLAVTGNPSNGITNSATPTPGPVNSADKTDIKYKSDSKLDKTDKLDKLDKLESIETKRKDTDTSFSYAPRPRARSSSIYENSELVLTPHMPIGSISDMRKIRSEGKQQFMTSMLHLGSIMWVVIGVHGITDFNSRTLLNVDYDDPAFLTSAWLILIAGIGGLIMSDVPSRISLSAPKLVNQVSLRVHLSGVFIYACGSNAAFVVFTEGKLLSWIFVGIFVVLMTSFRVVKWKMPSTSNNPRLVHRLSVFYLLTELFSILTCVMAGLLTCWDIGHHSLQCQ